MGHWAPTTLGNDHAWDVLGDLASRSRTRVIDRMLVDGLALDPEGCTVDAWVAPHLLALAEAVAAGLGHPSPDLLPEHAAWCAAHADLLAEHAPAAAAVLEPVSASPYAHGWHGPEGPARFQASVADLARRLAAGRTTPLAPAEDRFRRALEAPLEAHGWQATGPDGWIRVVEEGTEAVQVQTRRRAGRCSVLVWLSRDFPADQARLHTILGKAPPEAPHWAAIVRPPRGLWDRLGPRGWVPLFHPDDPADIHRESAVRVAAEKSVAWVERYGEAVLAGLRGPSLAEFLRTTGMDRLRRQSAASALLTWILVAQRVAPDAVDRLIEERRAQLARISSVDQRARLSAQLDQVDAATRGRPSPSP